MRQGRNFRAGYLLDASGERTIFSNRSFMSRQRWANNIFDDRNLSLILLYGCNENMSIKNKKKYRKL